VKRRVLLRPEAERDLFNSYTWYEKQRRGLGRRYLTVLEDVIYAIQNHPERFPFVHGNIQRAIVPVFPFALFFIQEKTSVVVLAIFHQSRDIKRLKVRFRSRLRQVRSRGE
jgi:plasmid stabilization system protein ParE